MCREHGAIKRSQAACLQAESTGLLPEIVEFDTYAEEYGPTGGWHEDNHHEFIRVLRRCRGDYSEAVLACCEQMVGLERLDIIAHARWHSMYEELAMRKRLALQEWRQRKDVAEAARRHAAADALPGRPATAPNPVKCGPCFCVAHLCVPTHCTA